MSKLLNYCCVLMSSICFGACQDKMQYDGMRSAEERQRYIALGDSMQHLRPDALQMITREMEAAKDSLSWYDYYLMYGRHYLLTDSPQSMLPYVERTLRYVNGLDSETPRTRGLKAMAVSSKASYLYLLHHAPDSVISLYEDAYNLLMQSDMTDNLPDLSANLGDAYVAKGMLADGSRWYRRALYLNDSLGLPARNTLTLYMGLGRICTSIGDFEQAGEYYRMTDKRIDEMKPNMQSYFLNNYGNYYYFKKDYPAALDMFRRLKAHLEHYHAEKNFDMYLCKINLADVFLNLQQPDSARYYVDEAERYFRQQGVDVGVYYAHTIRIGIAMLQKRYDEVERVLKEAEGLEVIDVDMNNIRRDYLNRYYAAIGNYHKAYAGMIVNMHKTDSLNMRIKSMRSADILTRLTEDTIRLHHQIEMNRRQAVYERNRNWGLLSLGVAIIIILLFVLWNNYQRKRYLQNYLDMLKLRMANARQRISPHFVFNVLNSRIAESNMKEGDQLMMLAQLIRANLDLTRKTMVTLKEELDFIEKYVNLEQRLSKMDIDFKIDAPDPETLERTMLPSMLIQILVENAILHGLKGKEGDRRLTVKVESDDADVRINVSDNGPGFDIRRCDSERTRTGLNIIRSTVNIVNQENKKGKMHFNIVNDNGCHATLTIAKDIKYHY